MTFSIIVPCYNCSDTIAKCLNSVFKQTFDGWELILVDDGSVDNTKEIIDDLKKDYFNKVKYIYQENKGPGPARNNGILHSNGDYICFLDADDYLDADFLFCVSKRIDTNPDIIFHDKVRETKLGEIISYSKTSIYSKKNKHELLMYQTAGTIEFGLNKIIKSSIIKDTQSYFSDFLVGEEAVFSNKVINNSNSFSFVDDSFYHYVNNAEGQHSKGSLDPWRRVVEAVDSLYRSDKSFSSYNRRQSISNLAMKSFAININRICLKMRYKDAKIEFKKSKKDYSTTYAVFKSKNKYLEKKVRIVKKMLRLHLFPLIYFYVRHNGS